MQRIVLKSTVLAALTFSAIGMYVGAQSVSEAPAGFDNQTNGTMTQADMDTAAGVFSEIDTPEKGLGPMYNGVSCAECHQNMAVGGGAQAQVLRAGHTARGEHSGDNYFHDFRRRRDTNGSSATFTAASAVLTNGDVIPDRSLINQRAICADAQAHSTTGDNTRTGRISLSVLGDGFVEAVPDSTFIALAKQNRGEFVMVPILEAPTTNEVGRFGWKTQHASLLSFAGDAYFNEMGITNELFPDELTSVCEPPGVPHPNDVDRDLGSLAAFMRATKVPPRGPITAQVNQGQAIFEAIGCASCHIGTLVTAPAGTTIHGGLYTVSAALGGKQFHPFGDFLLHDIGTGDGIQQNGPADTAYKIRTAPLWGLRTRTQMLHDGSVATVEDAIQRHDHEAADEAQRYRRLSPAQKQLFYSFSGRSSFAGEPSSLDSSDDEYLKELHAMKEQMPAAANSASGATPQVSSLKKSATGSSRRAFLAQVGGATAATIASAAVAAGPLAPSAAAQQNSAQPNVSSEFGSNAAARLRALKCFNNRINAAQAELTVRIPNEVTNGDETRFPNRIGNFSKGLVHNSIGEVDSASYNSLLRAVNTGDSRMFDQIIMGGTSLLIDPQAGLAFDLEGADSHALAIGTPPSVASREIADAAVENYWMALCRDVNFTQYGNEPLTQAAINELNSLQAFHGPKPVTPQNLFRGFTPGDLVGPYISQFLLQPFSYGAIPIEQLFTTYLPNVDYLTDQASWLSVQNGVPPAASNQIDPNPQHMRNGRGLGAYVHIDVLFEAYFNACLILVDRGAPLDPNHPYTGSRTQTGFGTFGAPHLKTLVAEVSQRALKTVWYMKWFVHRHLRPEEYGGLVHMTKTHQAHYPIHADVLNSDALARTFAKYGSYFMPHGFPEGCPQHPSYGQGHGTVAGACSTIVKAWFDDLAPISAVPGMQVFQASEDGFSLVPYAGTDAAQLTIGGEMNKIAANIAVGRNHAAVHWRYDYADSVVLGEAVAISMLKDMAHCWNEPFAGFSFTRFDGTRVTGIGKNT